MYQANEVYGAAFDLIVDVVWKRPAVFAGKSVRTDVITPFPPNDGSHRVLNTLMQVAPKSV